MKQLIFVLAFFLIGLSGFTQSKFIPASHQDFRYVGRFDFSNPREVRFDWSGVYIQFSFRSTTECAVRMSDTGHNYYQVFIDDQPSKTIEVKSDTTIVLASGIGTQIHSIYQKKNVCFVGIPTYLMVPEKDLGSDSHPNYTGQRKMAAHVLPVMAGILGWEYKTDEL